LIDLNSKNVLAKEKIASKLKGNRIPLLNRVFSEEELSHRIEVS